MPQFGLYPTVTTLSADATTLVLTDGLVSQISAQVLNQTVVDSIADLRLASVADLATGARATVLGYATIGDGGGGDFVYNSSDVTADNGGTIIAPTAGFGRWIRVYSGALNTLWFGSSLSATWAALPAAGGVVELGSNITISAATVLAADRPIIFEGRRRTITLAHPSGIGLSFQAGYSNRTSPIQIRDLVFVRGGAAANVIGVKLEYWLYGMMVNVQFRGFSTAGSRALLCDFVEDSEFNCIEFNDCATGLELTNATNQNLFQSCWFQGNSRALYIHGASAAVTLGGGSDLNTFNQCLFQSNTGVHTIDIIADTASGPNAQTFSDCWFEANGNSTANARCFYIFADTPFGNFLNVFIKPYFNGAMNGSAGQYMEWAGTGTVGTETFIAPNFGASGEPTFPPNTNVLSGGYVRTQGVIYPTVPVAAPNLRTLWDYNQGAAAGLAFTPAYVTSNADQNVTYTSQKGSYTKIGNAVWFQLQIVFNVVTSIGTGTIRISGLPFANGTDNNYGRYTVQFNDVNYDATKGIIYGYPPTNGVTYLQLLQQVDNAAWEAKTVSDTVVKAGSIISVSGFYFV